MNVEDFDNLKHEKTVWTIIDSSGNIVIFSVPDRGLVMVVDAGGGIRNYQRHVAREEWNNYMSKGYKLSNKQIKYDTVEYGNGYLEMKEDVENYYNESKLYALNA